jgi:hypothetical protein
MGVRVDHRFTILLTILLPTSGSGYAKPLSGRLVLFETGPDLNILEEAGEHGLTAFERRGDNHAV